MAYLHPDKHVSVQRVLLRQKARKGLKQARSTKLPGRPVLSDRSPKHPPRTPSPSLIMSLAAQMLDQHLREQQR